MEKTTLNGTKLVLAVETSGRVGSVALGWGETVLAESVFSGVMTHGAELFPHIRNLLFQCNKRPCDIGHVVITVGPGSFTGLRIAVTAAKMLYFAQQVRIIAADTTEVIAQNAPAFNDSGTEPIDCICTILDAKRNLFYASVFERQSDGFVKIFGTHLVTSEEILDWLGEKKIKKVYFLGEGLVYYVGKFRTSFTEILDEKYWSANAAGLLRIGQKLAAQGNFADPYTLTPLYIRKPEAVENWEKINLSRA